MSPSPQRNLVSTIPEIKKASPTRITSSLPSPRRDTLPHYESYESYAETTKHLSELADKLYAKMVTYVERMERVEEEQEKMLAKLKSVD